MTMVSGLNGYASSNGWTALTNPWGSSSLTYGKDYQISATYNSENLVSGTTFNWSYPKNNLPWTAIKAYPDVGFGASPWGRGQSDPAHVFPIQVDDLKSMKMGYDVTYGGDKSGYNVSYDVWFTSQPNGGTSTVTTELMIWLHQGGVNTFGKLVGTYSDANFTGKIYYEASANYIAVISDKDLSVGEIDLTAVVQKLVGMGIMSSDEYLASVQFGAEVVEGTGSLKINNLEYDVVSIDANGHEVAQTVTGLGVEGFNEIIGTSGNDYLPGDSLANTVRAGDGDDNIQPGKGNDKVYAGAGKDTIFGGEGDDVVYGEDGDDVINGEVGNDELHGGNGNDIFLDVAGSNQMFGDNGNDAFYLSGATVGSKISGGNGNDVIYAGSGNDVIDGGAGDDKIATGAGKDRIIFGVNAGNDRVSDFSVANDTIELHYDRTDVANPTAVNKTINGVSGTLVTFGGSTIFLENVQASTVTAKNFTFVSDVAAPNYNGTALDDTLYGSAGNDVIHGAAGADKLVGQKGNDILYGDAGNDSVYGGAGEDILYGNDGNDFLAGGLGKDTLYGGTGLDTAVFLGKSSDYTFVMHADGMVEVTDKVANRDGTDYLYDIDNLLFENGLTKVSAIHKDQEILKFDTSGAWKIAGADHILTDASGVTTLHFDKDWVIRSSDKTVTENGKTTTTHFEQNWKITGSEVTQAVGKQVVTTFFDANFKVTGAERVLIEGSKTTITHVDGANKVLSSEVDVVSGAKTTMTYYDGKGALTSSVVVTTEGSGSVMTQNFDKTGKLVSKDYVTHDSDGSTLVQHFDSTGKFHGAVKTVPTAEGVATYHFDAAWKVSGYEIAKTPVDALGSVDSHVSQDVFSHVSAALAASAEEMLPTPHFGI